MQIVSGNEHVTFSYDQARAAISEIEAAISQEQLKSEDKDAAPGNADGNQRQNNARKEAGCDKGSACWAEGLFDKCRKQLGGRTDPDKHTRFVLKRKRPHGISPHAVIFLQSLLLLYHVYWLPM